MCGISGLIGEGLTKTHEAMLYQMTDSVSHRGPDGFGYFISNDVQLGHRRLAIVDLSEDGKQPMNYLDRYTITYNGEVYNHVEIRAELEKIGYKFHSHSDTEVIMAAYDRWGKDCLQYFNGMWAFLIFDKQKSELFVARDRFGVKPLYYWNSGRGFTAFASEIKQFTKLEGWNAILNGPRAYDFLYDAISDHTDETFFEGVYQILPGTYSLISLPSHQGLAAGQRLSQVRWYDLTSVRVNPWSFEEASKKLKEVFYSAVSLRLRADVDVGSCLSGGIDSSSIVCVMNDQLREQAKENIQKTFSACATVKKFDEREYIEAVVEKTGVTPFYTYPNIENLFQSLDKITWHQDEPFGSTSIFAQWEVFKMARANNVKVMLDGQGADEQLAGYHNYYGVYHASLLRQFKIVTLIKELVFASKMHGYGAKKLLKGMIPHLLPKSLVKLLKSKVLSSEWVNKDLLFSSTAVKRPLVKTCSVRDLGLSQMTSSNLQMLLHWEDRDSMAHSVEARVPFVDYRFVEHVFSLPDDFKIRDGFTKAILRDAMTGILPDRIRNRTDKLGFVTPEEVWLRETATDEFRVLMKEAIGNSKGILTADCMTVLEEMISGKRSFSFMVWRCLSFGNWMKVFDVKLSNERVHEA